LGRLEESHIFYTTNTNHTDHNGDRVGWQHPEFIFHPFEWKDEAVISEEP
jgi:hypothetical protein